MSVVNVRMNKEEKELVKWYAETHGSTMSDVIKQAIFSLIEDEIDLKIYKDAVLRVDEKTYSHEEVLKEFGIKQ